VRPSFQIITDGKDVTAAIQSRFVSLTWHDERGGGSDSLSMIIDDRPEQNSSYIEMPRKGVELELSLGKNDKLISVGKFIVDETNPSGFPEILTIKAHAADMQAGLKEKKSRGFDNISVADLIATIATEQGLVAKVADSLANEVIKRIDQADENDLHLLTRLARERGAVAKIAYGYLLFVPKGEAKSVSGKVLPVVHLHRTDLTRWDATLADREKYNQVTARWYDKANAKEQQLHAGSGKPIFRIGRVFTDAASAQKAADARLKSLRAGYGFINIETVGSVVLVSEAEVVLSGMRPELNGSWVCDSVDHTLAKSSGWKAAAKLERKAKKGVK